MTILSYIYRCPTLQRLPCRGEQRSPAGPRKNQRRAAAFPSKKKGCCQRRHLPHSQRPAGFNSYEAQEAPRPVRAPSRPRVVPHTAGSFRSPVSSPAVVRGRKPERLGIRTQEGRAAGFSVLQRAPLGASPLPIPMPVHTIIAQGAHRERM